MLKNYQPGTRMLVVAANGSTLLANYRGTALTIDEAGGYFTFSASTAYTAGDYRYVIKDSDGDIIESGIFRILPSLGTGVDSRTSAQKALDAIIATIEGLATDKNESVAVDSMNLKRKTSHELLALKNHYQEQVDAELASMAGGQAANEYYTRFTK